MARQINYIKKNHVTCQIYTLFSPTFRDADIFENWIFSSLYIINKRHAPLVYKDLLFIALLHRFTRQNLINTVFVTGTYLFFFFNRTHWKSMPHELEQKAPSKTQWVGTRKESEQEDAKSKGAKKENHKKNQAHFPLKWLKGKPHDGGLRAWTGSKSMSEGRENTHEEFSYPLRLRVLGRRVKQQSVVKETGATATP